MRGPARALEGITDVRDDDIAAVDLADLEHQGSLSGGQGSAPSRHWARTRSQTRPLTLTPSASAIATATTVRNARDPADTVVSAGSRVEGSVMRSGRDRLEGWRALSGAAGVSRFS